MTIARNRTLAKALLLLALAKAAVLICGGCGTAALRGDIGDASLRGGDSEEPPAPAPAPALTLTPGLLGRTEAASASGSDRGAGTDRNDGPQAPGRRIAPGGGDGDRRSKPRKPLDPGRRKMIRKTRAVRIGYVDAAGDRGEHPHRGARDADGNWGYVHDETFLRGGDNSPTFAFPDREGACAVRDENYRMLTEKVFVDLEGEAEAERAAREAGRQRPRILCAIFTASPYHRKLGAIRNTWGPKCDGILFASNLTDPSLGTVDIPHEGIEEYDNIWQKVRSMWSYVYDNYYDKYDYFHSGGDDVYLIVENMRQYLESEEIQLASNGGDYLPDGSEEYQTPLYLGRRYALGGNRDNIFNSGGPGYTMNKVRCVCVCVCVCCGTSAFLRMMLTFGS